MPEAAGDDRGGWAIKIIKTLLDMIYPKRCALCDGVLTIKEQLLCCRCEGKAAVITENYCMKCGKPVEEEEEYCLDCSGKESSFAYGRAAFVYDNLMRGSISRFKYHGRQEYAEYYADVMYKQYYEWIKRVAPDALIPVPIHKERYRKRGFNQAELVAASLGKLCGVPVVSDYLVRTKNTLPQKELSDRERYVNLCRAFSIRTETQELYNAMKCVILIDDIYTTGSTIEACAQILSRQGVYKIYFLCISIGQKN
ncbi:MAG: ComF family protein [Lachnospiraceae bacterium]|nr:ComF family protein [Lachnospiraceae bacterium]